jgi:cation transport ATPase
VRVELLVTGMTCAACAAKVEGRLNAIENVSATVNIATEKATVAAPPSVRIQLLVEEIERAGYGAEVPGASGEPAEAGGDTADAARVAYLRRRLIVALVFFVPLSDLSVLLSLFPAYRFPGWQWREKIFRDGGLDIPAELAGQCAAWERAGRTVVLVGWDGQTRGAIAVADTVKPSAAAAALALRGLGLRTILLTGDNQATADAVAAEAGIGEVIAGAMPDGKVAVIARLQAQGRSVAMVGDGVNDGPALAAADLGLAIGSGTDVAICAADMILLRDDLGAVPEAIKLARATLATIRRNLAWAFGYNVAAIPLAAAGFLNPLIAGAAMAASSVFVVGNSARLRRFGMPAAGPGPRRRPATVEPGEPSGNGTGKEPGDETGTKEHTASCLE